MLLYCFVFLLTLLPIDLMSIYRVLHTIALLFFLTADDSLLIAVNNLPSCVNILDY